VRGRPPAGMPAERRQDGPRWRSASSSRRVRGRSRRRRFRWVWRVSLSWRQGAFRRRCAFQEMWMMAGACPRWRRSSASPTDGIVTSVSSPAANNRARRIASRLSVLTRSAGGHSVSPGARTPISIPSAGARRASPYPVGPASYTIRAGRSTPRSHGSSSCGRPTTRRSRLHPWPDRRSRSSTRARARADRPSGSRQACRHLLVDVARVEAGTFDANFNPAARGWRLGSTPSQPVLHSVPVLKYLASRAGRRLCVRVEGRTGA
jgi:hypothetical protein